MGKDKHVRTDLDRARDELMSLVHRCDVLNAEESERNAWLKETMDFMAQRYPSMSKMQLAQLELIGRRFCMPVIEHGAANTALSTDEGREDREPAVA